MALRRDSVSMADPLPSAALVRRACRVFARGRPWAKPQQITDRQPVRSSIFGDFSAFSSASFVTKARPPWSPVVQSGSGPIAPSFGRGLQRGMADLDNASDTLRKETAMTRTNPASRAALLAATTALFVYSGVTMSAGEETAGQAPVSPREQIVGAWQLDSIYEEDVTGVGIAQFGNRPERPVPGGLAGQLFLPGHGAMTSGATRDRPGHLTARHPVPQFSKR